MTTSHHPRVGVIVFFGKRYRARIHRVCERHNVSLCPAGDQYAYISVPAAVVEQFITDIKETGSWARYAREQRRAAS